MSIGRRIPIRPPSKTHRISKAICTYCSGTGRYNSEPCSQCNGKGVRIMKKKGNGFFIRTLGVILALFIGFIILTIAMQFFPLG
ncbi:MAG: hypothetical protein ACXADY_07185 [Candidatus Hodarchaeales archaeon]|jgi:hypothetical protein